MPLNMISISSILLQGLRVFFLIGFSLYAIFAFVATRQVDVMSKTIDTPLSPTLRLVSYLHLLVSLCAIAFVLFYLR